MAGQLVRQWLADYRALSPQEILPFTTSIVNDNELIRDIAAALEDHARHPDLLEPVCNQLLSFYRSKDPELPRFALQFIPVLVGAYLLAKAEKKHVKGLDVILLAVYNLEVMDPVGKPKMQSFRLPSISQPSIYHAPMTLSSGPLTENALSRLEKGDNTVINIGPFPHVENINAHVRMKVMCVLWNLYNRNVSFMTRPALHALCSICSRLVRQGCRSAGTLDTSHHRVLLSPPFLLEMLHSVYFAIYNGISAIGMRTLEDIYARASQELMVDVILAANAMCHSIKSSITPTSNMLDGPMGLTVTPTSTASSTAHLNRAAITNASFRTRKLPDDIPIQSERADNASNLGTISEENDEGSSAVERTRQGSGSTKTNGTSAPPILGSLITKIGNVGKKDKTATKEKAAADVRRRDSLGVMMGLLSAAENSGDNTGSSASSEGILPTLSTGFSTSDTNGKLTVAEPFPKNGKAIANNYPRPRGSEPETPTSISSDSIQLRIMDNAKNSVANQIHHTPV